MCNSIPNLSTACRGSIVEVAKITSVSMKTNQYSVTRPNGTGKYATRPHCHVALRNLITVVLKKYSTQKAGENGSLKKICSTIYQFDLFIERL